MEKGDHVAIQVNGSYDYPEGIYIALIERIYTDENKDPFILDVSLADGRLFSTNVSAIRSANMKYTTKDGALTLRRIESSYFLRDNVNKRVELLQPSDLEDLLLDPRQFADDGVYYVENPDYLTPGTTEFDEALCRDIETSPTRYTQHLWGLMAGCGLQTIVSLEELDAIFA